MIYARQSTAIIVTVGPVLDADGVAVTDGVVGDFKISKNGGAPAALNASATLTHRHTGHYSLSLTATDVNTVGTAEVVIDDTVNACPMKEIQVVEEAIYDALFAASANAFAGAAGSSTVVFSNTSIATVTTATNVTTVNGLAANVITAASIANAAIDAATFAADVDAEFLSYIVDDATRIDASALNTAAVTSIPAILADTGTDGVVVASGSKTGYTLSAAGLADFFDTDSGTTFASAVAGSVVKEIVDNAGGGSAPTAAEIADAVWDEAQADHVTAGSFGEVATEAAAILVDTAEIGAAGAGLTVLATAVNLATVDTVVDGIKAKTDSLSFTVAGQVDANTQYINDTELMGDGGVSTPWGPVP